MRKYRIYITYNSIRTERFPLYDAITYDWALEKGQLFFFKKLTNQFVFCDIQKDSVTDYTFFKSIEEDDSCAQVTIEVEKLCDGEYSVEWEGLFGVRDGSWDDDRCTFTIVPFPETNQNCLTDPIQVNVLGASPTVTTHFEDYGYATLDFERCRLLSDVLLFVAQGTCPSVTEIVSDFFQINPDNVSTINYVTLTPNLYTQITISQTSDTQNPIPSNAATKGYISWIELMRNLNCLFNVYWYLDPQGKVHIEHWNFFETAPGGLDLTQPLYAKHIKGTNKYSYDRSAMPSKETFEQMNDGSDFHSRLEYDGQCGAPKTEGADMLRKAGLFLSEYDSFFLGTHDELVGFTFFATRYNVGTGQYDHIYDDYYRTGQFWHTSPMQLMLRFFRHGNVELTGYYRDTSIGTPFEPFRPQYPVMFFSTRANKKQVPVSIPLCCDVEFDPTKKVTTFLGEGTVEKAQFNSKGDMLTLNLKYGNLLRTLLQPDDIPDLALWLDATVGVTLAGPNVTLWQDQSGNGRDFANNGTGPTVAAAFLNGLNCIEFSGGQGLLSAASWQPFPGKRGDFFIVLRHKTDSTFDEYIIGTHTAAGVDEFSFFRAGTSSNEFYFTLGGAVALGGFLQDILMDNWRIFDWSRPLDNQMRTIPNGFDRYPVTVTNTLQPGSHPWSIGVDPVATFSDFQGYIAEILVYDRNLTYIERQNVETYLSRKWGIEAV